MYIHLAYDEQEACHATARNEHYVKWCAFQCLCIPEIGTPQEGEGGGVLICAFHLQNISQKLCLSPELVSILTLTKEINEIQT